jgi:hypothetical protein
LRLDPQLAGSPVVGQVPRRALWQALFLGGLPVRWLEVLFLAWWVPLGVDTEDELGATTFIVNFRPVLEP